MKTHQGAQYLLRLDDANPWMKRASWDRVEALCDQYSVKPLVAIVPHCEDPALRLEDEDEEFWEKARRWQAKGWTIALHGYNHVLSGTGRGVVPLNHRTEFAGQSEAQQRLKLREGVQALRENGLEPTAWIAPAHTFDRVTVRLLQEETEIRIISDGLARQAFTRWGMTWLPQQLWKPRSCPAGLWTICLHPASDPETIWERLENFLKTTPILTVSEALPQARPWGLSDAVFAWSFLAVRRFKAWRKPRGKVAV